jgi:predicted DNA-binding antitoxin AbrB/MazE fold protein
MKYGEIFICRFPFTSGATSKPQRDILSNMTRAIHAIFDAGVFRPLEPVDLAEGTPVVVQLETSTAASSDVEAETQMSWQAYLDRMESLPDDSPRDGFTNRDHDRFLYGG